jgi:hypothetical protein
MLQSDTEPNIPLLFRHCEAPFLHRSNLKSLNVQYHLHILQMNLLDCFDRREDSRNDGVVDDGEGKGDQPTTVLRNSTKLRSHHLRNNLILKLNWVRFNKIYFLKVTGFQWPVISTVKERNNASLNKDNHKACIVAQVF